MNEPTGRELNDKIADIREWLVRIDTKVDFLNEVKRTAEEADAKAEKGLGLAEQNREDIDELETRTQKKFDELYSTNQFRFNIIVTAILAITGFLVTVGIAIFN